MADIFQASAGSRGPLSSPRRGVVRRITSTAALLFVAVAARGQSVHRVELVGLDFQPADLTIQVGDTVHWVWISGLHNVESGTTAEGMGVPDGIFNSGPPTPVAGTTFDVVFDQAFLAAHPRPDQVYPYYCVVHVDVGMVGSITVAAGECTTGSDCSDGIVCTDDSCVSGVCQHQNNTAACDDSDGCTVNDACSGGICRGMPAAFCCRTNGDCADSNSCTDDRCVGGQCRHLANNAPCDDGDICTVDDLCAAGQCAGTRQADCCHSDGDCSIGACETAACMAHGCLRTPIAGCSPCADAVACDDQNACTDDQCAQGRCESVAVFGECDDGDPCTAADACTGGSCVGRMVEGCCHVGEECDDADECTVDDCVEGGCTHQAVEGCQTPGDDDDEQAGPGLRDLFACGAMGLVELLIMGFFLVGGLMRRGRGDEGRNFRPCLKT